MPNYIVPIFQSNPHPYTSKTFSPKGWTESIASYLKEADRLSRCMMRNLRYMTGRYTWEMAINIEAEFSAEDIRSSWAAVCRKLKRAGIVALWVREPTKNNRCHYHLLIKGQHTRRDLDRVIEAAMPPRSDLKYHKHVALIDNVLGFVRYMVKAKVSGFVDGRYVEDKYRSKRLLFKPRLGLRKVGTIGHFWEKPKADLWQEIRDYEKRISEGLEQKNIREVAKAVYELLGGAVPLRKIERSFAYAPDHPAVKHHIESLLADD